MIGNNSFRSRLVVLGLSTLFLGGAFFYLSQKNRIIVLELELHEAQIPSLEMTLSGERVRAYLDLGAEMMTVTRGAIPESCFEVTSEKQSISSISRNNHDLDVFLLKECYLGDIRLRHLPFVVEPTSTITCYLVGEKETKTELHLRPPIVLGNDIFQNLSFLIDYKNRRLVLAKNSKDLLRVGLIDDSYHSGRLSDWGEHFVIQGEIDGEIKKLVLDTGATINVLFEEGDSSACHFLDRGVKSFKWEGHNLDIGTVYQVNQELGKVFDGCLGTPFFERHAIFLDPKKGVCWIKPYDVSESLE